MRANKLFILPILAALLIANMGAIAIVRAPIPPTEYLYVDGFDATYVEWTAVGTSPYLDAPGDGSYIEGTADAAFMAWFTFEDIDWASPTYADYAPEAVWLQGYTDGPYDENVDFDVYNAAFDWMGSLYANGSPQWLEMRWISPGAPTSDSDPTLLSQSGLNAWKCLIYFYDPTGVGPSAGIIDSLRLKVTFKLKPPPPIPFMMVNPEVNTAEVCETFAIEIMIPPEPYTPVYDLYGYEFKLAYNPAVITATEIALGDFFPPNAVEWMNSIDNEAGIAWYSVTMPFGSTKGVSGSGVLAVITFHVEAVGVSGLDIHDTMMGNRYGFPIYHLIKDGVFANSENFAVCIKTAQREHRKFSISGDEDGFQDISGTIKNYGDITQAYVEFTIFDGMGAPIGDPIPTATVAISPNEMKTLGISWQPPPTPEDYSVEARVYYMDQTGAWIIGQKGDPTGEKDLMTIYFSVEP